MIYTFSYSGLPHGGPVKEFHISRRARVRYEFDDALFSFHGNMILADYAKAQRVAYIMNSKRDVAHYPEMTVKASDLYAAGLIDEILHLVLAAYRQEVNPDFDSRAYETLAETLGEEELEHTLRRFATDFPATPVHKGEMKLEDYLAGETDGVKHKQVVLEELLLLYLHNNNPAMERFGDLFDDTQLKEETHYLQIIETLSEFFDDEPGMGGIALLKLLRAPALAAPTSLEGQLEFLRGSFAPLLGDRFDVFMNRILRTFDFIKEEHKGWEYLGGHTQTFRPLSEAPTHVMDPANIRGEWISRSTGPVEYERFSPDSSWMPRVVMLAKSTFVWLDQLSREYGRDITRLDQIPDEELDELARRGFSALWLIGLWERSEASKRIKHLRGNPDAVASAYSLYDYVIAYDLGGEEAYETLKTRAWQRGIRMASDMVPNHMGIDSRWVIEHPDWFLWIDHSPYPGYTFNGPDLSPDSRVTIQLEDHYYDSTDAAVVFRRTDNATGQQRYIYHGNDGTTMPWNDTAQLDFIKAEVREGVIQTILHVARKSPVIRFDAAMTLAKQHVQRLWFPEPGQGGAIPSRAQYGSMTNEEFDSLIPEEFWREVVDRVAEEVPDTLLLAEAFWMMEGYFVRTLGMHRVYNSAFMHMLKREENEKYRLSMKNVLEFDPQILKRYVNFMNNPDEETAIAQFGKDDKYIGVCLLMSTLPGLPMYGHGQVEGYTEKYGMEYRRPKYNEQPDKWLIERHHREVFPILHRRKQFAEVENFLLYDFIAPEGYVNEDVYAFSNNVDGEASLMLYNNKFTTARGWINVSAPYAVKNGEEKTLVTRTLHEGLGLLANSGHYTILREHTQGLEYLRRSSDIADRGFYFELGAFKYAVFIDIHEVVDNVWSHYGLLHDELNGRGVPSIKEALEEIGLRPLHARFGEVLRPETFNRLRSSESEDLLKEVSAKYLEFLTSARDYGYVGGEIALSETFTTTLETILTLRERLPEPLEQRLALDTTHDTLLVTFAAVRHLGDKTATGRSAEPLSRWQLRGYLQRSLEPVWGGRTHEHLVLLSLLTRYDGWYRQERNPALSLDHLLENLRNDEEAHHYLRINEHEGVRYFNKEALGSLMDGFLLTAALEEALQDGEEADFALLETLLDDLTTLEEYAQYRLERLILPKGIETAEAEETEADALTTAEAAGEEAAEEVLEEAAEAEETGVPEGEL